MHYTNKYRLQIKKHWLLFLMIALAFVFHSCKTYEPIKIQVLKPAKIPVSSNINKVILINHCNYPHSVFTSNDSLYDPHFNIDSFRTMQYFAGLVQVLNNSPRFKVVNSTPLYILKPNYTLRYMGMEWSDIQKLCNETNADAAIVLENYQAFYSDKSIANYINEYGYYGSIGVQNSSLWKFYAREDKIILDDYILKDTLYWNANGIYLYEIANKLPDANDAVIQSCFYAGTVYGERIAQTWTTKNRYLVSCEKSDFKNAILFAKQGKWEDAIVLWKKYPYGENNRFAAFSSYNLAIASETLDNIDAALEWAAKSYLLRNDIFVKNYIDILEQRKKEKTEIENQLK
jgi:hypothetical protein